MTPAAQAFAWALVVPKTVQDAGEFFLIRSRSHHRGLVHAQYELRDPEYHFGDFEGARDYPQRSSLHNHKEGVMNAKSMFKMGLLSIIAATGLCGVSNGVAADVDTRDHSKGETTTAGSDDFDVGTRSRSEGLMATGGSDDSKMPESRASQLQVVDSEGNAYLLTPLDKHGKATVEYVVPYTMPTSH